MHATERVAVPLRQRSIFNWGVTETWHRAREIVRFDLKLVSAGGGG
jgi:hypothetical protein